MASQGKQEKRRRRKRRKKKSRRVATGKIGVNVENRKKNRTFFVQ